MSASDRVYRLLLRLYPEEFRAAFGDEMSLLFREQRRAAAAAGETVATFWIRILWDLACSAPAERAELLRARVFSNLHPEGRVMKTLAIASMLAGLFEAFNASAEGWYGGVAARDTHALTAGALGALAGVLLVVAGAALLRRARGAASLVQGSAIGCLVSIILAAVLGGRLSIFATLVGVVVPVALLVLVRRDRAEPRVA